MFALVDPHPRFRRSFLEAADEFHAAGQDPFSNLVTWPAEDGFAGEEFTRSGLESPDEFERFTSFLVGQRLEDAPRPPTYVPCTEKWMTDGPDSDAYLGRISLRHRLNDLLLTWGGHIGYGVRPSARRRGCATQALAAMLPVCAELGIDQVLVTCDIDNVASRRTIEKNGGIYEDTRQGKLRYWIPTGAGSAHPEDQVSVRRQGSRPS
jgi:predicted acetyltransferase